MKNNIKTRLLVCGGGNAAHCLVAFAASTGFYDVSVLSLFSNEAERWSRLLQQVELNVLVRSPSGTRAVKGNPRIVTKEPQLAMESVQIIFLAVPATVHGHYLNHITPYLMPNSLLVGLPGQAGFEFQIRHLLGEKTKCITLVSFETLPWSCRSLSYGKNAEVLGTKSIVQGSVLVGSECRLNFPYMDVFQSIFGEKPEIKLTNHVNVTLMTKSILHPPIMYGKWRNFDGSPMPDTPLFYQGIDEKQTRLLSTVSDEVQLIANEIQSRCPSIDMSGVRHIYDWYKMSYGDQIVDDSTLISAIKTNMAYHGLRHPMKSCPGGFTPNFSHRYLSEDVPFGMVVLKGVAEIVGVLTPTIDEIIEWAQGVLNKEYIIAGKLKGKDVGSTRAPQIFNLHTISDIQNFWEDNDSTN